MKKGLAAKSPTSLLHYICNYILHMYILHYICNYILHMYITIKGKKYSTRICIHSFFPLRHFSSLFFLKESKKSQKKNKGLAAKPRTGQVHAGNAHIQRRVLHPLFRLHCLRLAGALFYSFFLFIFSFLFYRFYFYSFYIL